MQYLFSIFRTTRQRLHLVLALTLILANGLTGVNALWVADGGSDAVDSQQFFYPSLLDTWLITAGFIDLSQAQMADVEFAMRYDTEAEFDYLFVGASIDGETFYGDYYSFGFPTISFTNNASYPSYLGDSRFTAQSTGRQLGDIIFDVYYAAVNNWVTALRNVATTTATALANARAAAQKVEVNGDDVLTTQDPYIIPSERRKAGTLINGWFGIGW